MLKGWHHSNFTVSDMERSLAFYRDLLGIKVVAQQVGTAPYLSTITGFSGVQLKVARDYDAASPRHRLREADREGV